ncbi:MAG: hypothetical protein IJN63_01545 [Clostridia bacterium]|nr:hypothetical protein [Clostridia bacterium]
MTKRVLCLILAAMCVGSMLVSCGDGKTEGPAATTPAVTTDGTATTTEPVTTEPAEALDIPEGYFLDGYEYTILCTALMTNPPTPFAYKDTELVLDDAVYRRNTIIEDTYGISIEVITEYTTTAGKAVARLQANRSAGDTLYDAGLIDVFGVCQLAHSGYLADLQDVPYVALEKSWWDQNATRDTSIFGKTFFTTGDISFLDKEYTFATIFNKTIAEEKQLGDLYAIVREGKWTIDVMADMCKLVSEDLNGDDKLDSNDKFGLITWDAMLTASINGSGNTIAHIEDDELVLSLNNEEVISVVEKYVGLAQHQSVHNFQHTTGGVGWIDMFNNGQALFLHEYLKALPSFRDTDLEYGILPMPKLSEEQENYYCGFAGYQTAMYCIPVDVYDEEISGVISEAMAYHSKLLVTPAYYDRTLIGRNVQDPESEETLNIIFANRIYDLGLFYKVGTYGTQLGYLLRDKNTDFSSMFEKFRTLSETDLKKINGFFESGNE